MSAHTPGPWRVDPQYFLDVQTNDGALEIATVALSVLSEVETPPAIEQRANARLMAAAPDLLTALEMAAGYVGVEGSEEEHELVQAAIAKATQP